MLPLDLPTLDQLRELAQTRAAACVSIYLPTTPLTQETDAARIELGNLAREAARQLAEGGADDRSFARETRSAQVDFGVGQLVGVTAAVGWYAGFAVGVAAGATAAALVWFLVPRSRAVVGGAVVAAVATALLA